MISNKRLPHHRQAQATFAETATPLFGKSGDGPTIAFAVHLLSSISGVAMKR
jgi:hypothetical protein